jgi:hypothetical protein
MVGTSTSAIDASFLGIGTSAGAMATEVTAATGTLEADMTAAATTVETETTAMKVSLGSLLGPLAAVAAALYGYNKLATNYGAQGGAAGAGLQTGLGAAAGPTALLSKSDLANLDASMGATTSGQQYGTHGAMPWTPDNIALVNQAKAALTTYSKTGDASGLQGVIGKAQALAKHWPQDRANLQPVIAAMQQAQRLGQAQQAFGGAVTTGQNAAASSPSGFARSFLTQIGAPITAASLSALNSWWNAEESGHVLQPGHGGTNNPFEVSWGGNVPSSATSGNSIVKSYATPQQGVQAAINYFSQYGPGVLAAFRGGQSVSQIEAAVRGLGPNAFGSDTATAWAGGGSPSTQPVSAGTGGSGLPSGTQTLPGVPGKPASTSFHYDWQTGTYRLMTAAQYKALQDAWYAANPGKAMPSSAATAKLVTPGMALGTATGGITPARSDALFGNQTSMNAALAASLRAEYSAEGKQGQKIIGSLTDATQTGTLSGLTTALNYTHTKAMGQLLETLSGIHTKAAEKETQRIEAVYQKAVEKWVTLSIAAQNAAAEKKLMTDTTNAAALQDKTSKDLGSLYAAGLSLGLPGQSAAAGALASERPLTGSVTGAGLSPVLASLIPQLEGGPLSQGAAAGYAKQFSGGELGTLFGALASGGLNATDTSKTYDTIYSLMTSLAQLQTALGDNTAAVANNTATMINLLQQQNTILSQRVALGANQTSVLRNFIPNLPHFATGGPVVDDGLIYAHAGEHVVPQGGSLVMGGGAPTIQNHFHAEGSIAPLISLIRTEIRHPENVRAVSQQIGTRTSQLSGAPGGWR